MRVVQLILQDFGEDISDDITDVDQFNTGASEAVRPFLSDVLEFIADLHVLSKLKVTLSYVDNLFTQFLHPIIETNK